MKTSESPLEEQPTLYFVQNLADSDTDFQRRFVTTLKKEFSRHYIAYHYHMEMDEPRAAAEIVHKLKYSLSYLDMKNSFALALRHQEKLEQGNTKLHNQFNRVLITVKDFLLECKL